MPQKKAITTKSTSMKNTTLADGGDPNTAPRLFTLTVAKADGKVSVDDPVSGETRVLK